MSIAYLCKFLLALFFHKFFSRAKEGKCAGIRCAAMQQFGNVDLPTEVMENIGGIALAGKEKKGIKGGHIGENGKGKAWGWRLTFFIFDVIGTGVNCLEGAEGMSAIGCLIAHILYFVFSRDNSITCIFCLLSFLA